MTSSSARKPTTHHPPLEALLLALLFRLVQAQTGAGMTSCVHTRPPGAVFAATMPRLAVGNPQFLSEKRRLGFRPKAMKTNTKRESKVARDSYVLTCDVNRPVHTRLSGRRGIPAMQPLLARMVAKICRNSVEWHSDTPVDSLGGDLKTRTRKLVHLHKYTKYHTYAINSSTTSRFLCSMSDRNSYRARSPDKDLPL